ncbi:thiamine diphosphokinase [Gemella sp. GH3]|uniref:thiamine diphosphokinase n=1 Tax=unclassified Gemella TaxID=2624949 RepID=UPI0015CF9B3E|nr:MULTISPECIES: thiamine diphosphokinase [unclassified Gemella]MBF0713244.1 thiamine diphosphokinase [Gemella sp. GH3.1]NYS50196.1 thiamine diphosphokinase [Gemella sp. GH3]
MDRLQVTELNLMFGGLAPKFLPKMKNWCAVDSGLDYLLHNGITPLAVYGDFDSLTSISIFDSKNIIFRKKHSQNLTDGEFALEEIIKDFPNIQKVTIYGATGKRLDHFYGNMLLLNNPKYKQLNLTIIDDNNYMYVVQKGKHVIKNKISYKYISFVPIYENTIINIKNAKYNAEILTLSLIRPSATSNEFVESKDIELITNKECLVIYAKD